tara:strand:+ start:217 stop:408 length:192 start_codon:yes stop_codon:yes gene_type:complete
MTALRTSLALPLYKVESPYRKWATGFQILILMAVRKCIEEQYWKKVLTKEAYERRNKEIIKRN